MTSVGGHIYLEFNDVLEDIPGMAGIVSATGGVFIEGNTALKEQRPSIAAARYTEALQVLEADCEQGREGAPRVARARRTAKAATSASKHAPPPPAAAAMATMPPPPPAAALPLPSATGGRMGGGSDGGGGGDNGGNGGMGRSCEQTPSAGGGSVQPLKPARHPTYCAQLSAGGGA